MRDLALQRAEAAGAAVAKAIGGYFDRLEVAAPSARSDLDADLRAASRLMARHTRRQLAANLTLARRLMEARSLPAVLQLQQDFLRRQTDWAIRDWQLVSAQALDLLAEVRRRGADGPEPDTGPPEPGPSGPGKS